MGQVRFKVCSEVLEYRRRAIYRHQKFVKQLALFSSMLSRRRRNQHGNRISLNQIAEKMARYVKKKDRADDKLLAKYMTKYMKEIRVKRCQCQAEPHKLPDCQDQEVQHVARSLQNVHEADQGYPATLDLYEPWIHPDEVVKRLKIALSQMYQTTTAMHWLQVEVKGMLEEAMERLFWT